MFDIPPKSITEDDEIVSSHFVYKETPQFEGRPPIQFNLFGSIENCFAYCPAGEEDKYRKLFFGKVLDLIRAKNDELDKIREEIKAVSTKLYLTGRISDDMVELGDEVA